MADCDLYCFAESGNSYKVALMLNLAGLDWRPVLVDFFNGETRSDTYRSEINEMGEVPVMVHGDVKLTQSGVMLDYLAQQSGKFGAKDEAHRREIWRWILFDNHKLTSYVATLRFLTRFAGPADPAVTEFLAARANGALGIVDKHLAKQPFVAGEEVSIADLSMCGYLYFKDELGIPLEPYQNIAEWLDRLKALPGWKHPYDLMPSALGGSS